MTQERTQVEHAKTALDYLNTYNYATLYHALLHTLWHTTAR
ncbi:MAG: hypothetical protein U5L09_17930 [Bacteroidales bacterium]|nr:hypothetical protein [Bacteroidales bacterium]